jgi:hypothetical protein
MDACSREKYFSELAKLSRVFTTSAYKPHGPLLTSRTTIRSLKFAGLRRSGMVLLKSDFES